MQETVEFVDFKEINNNTKRLHLDKKGRWFWGHVNITFKKVFGEVCGPDKDGNYYIKPVIILN